MKNREEMLLRIMHALSEKFKDRIVLEGGMLLRLLDSARSTQDVDYVFLSKESKKVLVHEITKTLSGLPEVEIGDVELNSRGIFITLTHANLPKLKAMVEINVAPALHCAQGHMSTAALAGTYSMGGRVISTMSLPEAFAHKIAATLERNSVRDLYDINILEGLCAFDVATLQERLERLSIERKKTRKVTFSDAAALLEKKAQRLSAAVIKKELAPLLPPGRGEGLEVIIKASVVRVVKRMRSH